MWRGFQARRLALHCCRREHPRIGSTSFKTPFAKRSRIPNFTAIFLKLVGEEAEPLMPEELAQAIRDMPRDTEVTELLKALSGAGPLPPR